MRVSEAGSNFTVMVVLNGYSDITLEVNVNSVDGTAEGKLRHYNCCIVSYKPKSINLTCTSTYRAGCHEIPSKQNSCAICPCI